MTTRQLKATSPAATTAAPEPPPKPKPRVRHVLTGDVGTLVRVVYDCWFSWGRVAWDDTGPGMRDSDGHAIVAPALLIHLDNGRRVTR